MKKSAGLGCLILLGVCILVSIFSYYTSPGSSIPRSARTAMLTPTLRATRSPTPTPMPTPAQRVELREAQGRGLVQVAVSGDGIESIRIDLESKSSEPVEITILPGTVFKAGSDYTQDMVVRKRGTVALGPTGSKRSITLLAACASMRLGVPGESDEFTISEAPAAEDLIKLLDLPDFLDESFRVQQFAIWTITDNPASDDYVGLGYFGVGSGPDAEEMQRIRALFEKAGITTEKYQALR